MSERLAALIADRTPVSGHRPWPRYEIDDAAWVTIAQELGKGGGDLLSLWGDQDQVHLAIVLMAGLWLPEPVVRWFRAVAAQLG